MLLSLECEAFVAPGAPSCERRPRRPHAEDGKAAQELSDDANPSARRGLAFVALLYAGRGYWAWTSAAALAFAAWALAGLARRRLRIALSIAVLAAALFGSRTSAGR